MNSDLGILSLTGIVVGLIAAVLIIHRWYANTTLYRNPRR